MVAKRVELARRQAGRDRICVQVIFNSGQTLDWVCPWRFWDLLMSDTIYNKQRKNLNTWETLLFYIETSHLQDYSLFTVRELLETLWASVGLSLTWSEIEKVAVRLLDFQDELGNWDWWLSWVAVRGFLARQEREREKWIGKVN